LFYDYLLFYHFNFEFTKLNCCCDFIAKNKWPPIHPTSIHLIITFGAMPECCHRLQPKPKTIPEFKDALQTAAELVCITKARNQQCCERLAQVIADMCVSQW